MYMNNCYIRRKGTNRWLRFRGFEAAEKNGIYSFSNDDDITAEVTYYHEENSLNESDTYEITKDKGNITTVEVKMYLQPYFSGEVK